MHLQFMDFSFQCDSDGVMDIEFDESPKRKKQISDSGLNDINNGKTNTQKRKDTKKNDVEMIVQKAKVKMKPNEQVKNVILQ